MIILDAQIPSAYQSNLGGKAQQLLTLTQAGLPVPAWVCVSAALFRDALQSMDQHLSTEATPKERQNWLALSFPYETLNAALANYLDPSKRYAVRSSANAEDGGRYSFAGQFESYLQVPAHEVVLKILRCWQSVFSDRVGHYLHDRPWDMIQMAVIIQEMCPSEAAGVMFMANPVGALSEIVINAAWGLGEGVVSDRVESDTYRYDRFQAQWQEQIIPKYYQIRPGHFDGIERIPVPLIQRDRAVLDTEQCHSLMELGLRVEVLYPHYLDIEWGLDAQGQFWLLQARPITTLFQGEKSLFDNSNVVESYPGVSSPLTYSWIRGAYSALFRQVLLKLGISQAAERPDIFEHLVAHLQGRVYYHLSHWYQMFRLIPGTEPYIRVWAEMMGIRDADTQAKRSLSLTEFFVLGRVVLLACWHFLFLDRQLRSFRMRFAKISDAFWREPQAEHAHAILRRYHFLRHQLLGGWEITLLNDAYAFIFTALTQFFLRRAHFKDATALFNDLLCGQVGMESVEPVHSVITLAERLRQSPELKAILPAQVLRYDHEALSAIDFDFAAGVQAHLTRYGERYLAELKLETVTLREDPRLLLKWIADYAQTSLSLQDMQEHEDHIRRRAEHTLRTENQLPFWERPFLHFCLTQARHCINQREGARLDRARAFGIVRHLFRALGQDLYQQGIFASPEQVFLLSIEELEQLVYGAGAGYDWAELILWRERQLALWQAQSLPERILCQGPVGVHLMPLRYPSTGEPEGFLQGTGCAPGVVSAEAIVIRDPQNSGEIRGKILVAEMTDPGWVFLMLQSAGLVVEKGSLLSHTAIIGRELGIPTIVGVSQATQRIRSGEQLQIDGQRGTIQRL